MSCFCGRLRNILESLPDGSAVSLTSAALEEMEERAGEEREPDPPQARDLPEPTWREHLWTVPAETRLGVRELAEALGRSKSFVYHRTSQASALDRLPHRKFFGELVFLAGEIREWVRVREEVAR